MCFQGPKGKWGCSTGTREPSRAGSQSRVVPSAPWGPPTAPCAPRPWECGTQRARQRHLCCLTVKERPPPPPANPPPPATPCAQLPLCDCSPGAARQHVLVTGRLQCPGPRPPWWAQCQAPHPAHRGPEHLAHTTSPRRPLTHTHSHTMQVLWGRHAHERYGVSQPLGLGTRQPGCGTSATQGRMCWHAIPACVRPCPNPPPPPLNPPTNWWQ